MTAQGIGNRPDPGPLEKKQLSLREAGKFDKEHNLSEQHTGWRVFSDKRAKQNRTKAS
jgi:hypothetical protein